MKRIVFFTLLVVISFSCQNKKKEISEEKTVKIVKTVPVGNPEKTEQIFGEFKFLYNELLSFKDKADFKKYGFGVGSSYNIWLKNVEKLKANPDSKLLLKNGVVAGELGQLGFEYVSSKGKETETTIFFNKVFSDAISRIKVEKVETASGNSNYEKIKSEYILFGKWQISVELGGKSYGGYPIEIYTKNNKYIQVTTEGEFETEILEKKGIKYYQKSNESGEYYKIDSNKNMTLFDKDGELSSYGYKATKK